MHYILHMLRLKQLVRIARALRAKSSIALLAYVAWHRIAGRRENIIRPNQEGESEAKTPTYSVTPGDHSTLAASIPKIIFQTWKNRTDLPPNYRYWSNTLRALNPQHEYVLWDDKDNRAFIDREFPWFLPQYDSYPREIFRADIIRLFFLYRFGGLYADLDTECLRPIDTSLAGARVVLGRMGTDSEFPHSIPNAMMASAPFELFWLLAIAMAIERVQEINGNTEIMRHKGPEALTGPILIKDAFDYYVREPEIAIRQRADRVLRHIPHAAEVRASDIRLLDPTRWYPLDWSNFVHELFRREIISRRCIPSPGAARWLFPKAELVTYWTHSW